MRFLSYLVTLLIAVFVAACGGGGGSPGTITGSNALRTNVPNGLTMVVTDVRAFTIEGGKTPYSVISNREGIAVAGVDGSTLAIGGVFPGSAELTIRDSLGQKVTAAVTITENALALATTAPSSVTAAVGRPQTYTVRGGIAPYVVTSANPNIVAATLVGQTLTLTGITPGTSSVAVRDSLNALVSIGVTVTPAAGLALFTTAPTALTAPTGTTLTFSVGGGVPPYAATSSNSSVATVTLIGNTLTIYGNTSGSASISIRDSVGAVLPPIAVVVPPPAAIFSNAPSNVTIALGTSPVFVLGGGQPPYTAVSTDTSVASASVAGTNLTINALKAGSATIQVRDSLGGSLSPIVVTVPPPPALSTTAPSTVSIAASTTQTYSVSGGAGAYTITNTNPFNVLATISGSSPAGTLTVTGLLVGDSTLTIRDAAGGQVVRTVSVIAPGSKLSVLPASLSISERTSVTPIAFSIFGGVGPYRAFTDNMNLTSVSVSGSTLTVGVGANGTWCVDETTPVSLTVIDNQGAAVSSTLTITDAGTSCPP